MREKFMREAIAISRKKMKENCGGPFGCVIVKDGKIIARGWNKVTSTNDPTAHGEVTAIRAACKKLKSFQLDGCEVYTSAYPCPMCLGAIFWARPEKVFYANTARDSAKIDFDDEFIYGQIKLPPEKRAIPFTQILREEAIEVFREWEKKGDKIKY